MCQETLRTNRKPAAITGSLDGDWRNQMDPTCDRQKLCSINYHPRCFFLWSGLPSPKFSMGSFEIHRKLLIWHIRLPTSAGFFKKKIHKDWEPEEIYFFPIPFFCSNLLGFHFFPCLTLIFLFGSVCSTVLFSDCRCPLAHIYMFPTHIMLTELAIQRITRCIRVVWKLLGSVVWAKRQVLYPFCQLCILLWHPLWHFNGWRVGSECLWNYTWLVPRIRQICSFFPWKLFRILAKYQSVLWYSVFKGFCFFWPILQVRLRFCDRENPLYIVQRVGFNWFQVAPPSSFPFSDVLLPASQAFVFLLISPSINTSAVVMFCGQTNAPYRIYIRVIGELADPRGIRH